MRKETEGMRECGMVVITALLIDESKSSEDVLLLFLN